MCHILYPKSSVIFGIHCVWLCVTWKKTFLFTCKQYLKLYSRFSHNHVFKVGPHDISETTNRSLSHFNHLFKISIISRGRRNFYTDKYLFITENEDILKWKMNFDFTHSLFCKKSEMFKTLHPYSSQQNNLLMNPIGIFDWRWSSLEQQWEPHNTFFGPLEKLRITPT